MVIIHVAVPVPLRQLFCYSHSELLPVGVRVSVPFGSRKVVGVVVTCDADDEITPSNNLKDVSCVLDTHTFLDSDWLKLAMWLADYYHFPIGETITTMLPGWLRKEKSQQEITQLTLQTAFRLTDTGRHCLDEQKIKTQSHLNVVKALNNGEAAKDELLAISNASILRNLMQKGWIERFERTPSMGHRRPSFQPKDSIPKANIEQAIAIGALCAQLETFSISLLEGVTGSGKTEVYLQVIEKVIKNGRQVLILVPEIGLTPQTLARFKARFGFDVGAINSSISDKKRTQIWLKAKQGQLPIVIGTRSAVFTPFFDLGMIIIDEEHDDALKQQDGLRYHARDVAAVRAKNHHIPLVLGSATPSLESLNNALTGKYQYLTLRERAGEAQTVTQHILDIKHEPIHSGLSESAIEQMHLHLSRGNQVLLFLNRRGFAPILLCHACGHVESCHRCDRPMTWHKQKKRLECHHCDIQRPVPQHCSECEASEFISQGVGTEQLESQCNRLFPQYNTVRIDRDNTRTQTSFERMYEDIQSLKANILVGTQMLAKGHHFPNVTLVVLVDVDGGLFSLDVRAQEKLAQLVTQISGRAGRASKKGYMILQTHHPHHPILQELVNNGYNHVARLLLAERQALNCPPYYSQAIIRAESVDKALCQQVLLLAKNTASGSSDIVCIGPVPALVEKRLSRYRFMLVLRAGARKPLHYCLNALVQVLQSDKQAKKCRWSVDVDAIDLS
jgi:primosomal protein N' (replication factor Y)